MHTRTQPFFWHENSMGLSETALENYKAELARIMANANFSRSKEELEKEGSSRPYFDTGQDPPGGQDPKKKSSSKTKGEKLSLPKLYWHYQYGGQEPLVIDASSVDFGGLTQQDIGITKPIKGNLYEVDLYSAGISQASLALGRVSLIYEGNNHFSIVSGKFDFDPLYDSNASWKRNVGNLIGAFIFTTPTSLIFGGPFWINFVGTVYIPPK